MKGDSVLARNARIRCSSSDIRSPFIRFIMLRLVMTGRSSRLSLLLMDSNLFYLYLI
jgi:hypothetical protein